MEVIDTRRELCIIFDKVEEEYIIEYAEIIDDTIHVVGADLDVLNVLILLKNSVEDKIKAIVNNTPHQVSCA